MISLHSLASRAVSGSAVFRTQSSKLSMLASGKLSIQRIVKYAITGEGALGASSRAYLLSKPQLHEGSIGLIAKYLYDNHFTASNRALAESTAVLHTHHYHLRQIARELLAEIGDKTPNLSERVDSILSNAPQIDVTWQLPHPNFG